VTNDARLRHGQLGYLSIKRDNAPLGFLNTCRLHSTDLGSASDLVIFLVSVGKAISLKPFDLALG
jgi:hypothetical protein